MKSIQFLVFLMLALFSLSTFAQSFETDEMDPELNDQSLQKMEDESELMAPVSDELSVPDEIERQEDMQYPEGEDSSWSLGSEDLPAEEYE
jgi:hypothetical protein